MDPLLASWLAPHEIWEIAVSPDGSLVAAGNAHLIMVYNVHTMQQIYEPLEGDSSIICVIFSPDGQMIAASSRQLVRIWYTRTGQELCSASDHQEYVYHVTFSPDSRFLISGSHDRTIRIREINGGQLVTTCTINTKNKVYSLIFSSNGALLLALCAELIEVYDASTWRNICRLHRQATGPTAVCSPDSRYIISAAADGIRVWDLADEVPVDIPFQRQEGSIVCLAFSPDSKYVATGSAEMIRIWDASTGALQSHFPHGHQDRMHRLDYFPDGKKLVSGSPDRMIKIWDMYFEGEMILEPNIEPKPEVIATLGDVVLSLSTRGCVDLTNQLDMATCSDYPISSGGFGDIYKCKLFNGMDVAVKTIRIYVGSNDQDRKHLKYAAKELYTWSKCKHVNVQPLLGLAMFRGQVGMIAEWELSGSMPEYLDQHPDVDRCVMCVGITEGLSYLHASGVVHGDLKGANVLISRSGVPRLADFGNAKLKESTLKFTKSSTNEQLTSQWAAPELFEGSSCSFETDIYALGMETITGDVPWPGKSERFILLAVTVKNQRPERPETHIPTYSEQGDMLWSLLQWCWGSNPEMRPTAEEVKGKISIITKQGLTSGEVEMGDV
ncbi:Tyrosine kinase family catalytic domain protein [Ceratobasidium sp. AG-Ba]|nr:Tyrosine kinase family catalytic domain protein [Ceratobasidium sp. AG-Ba]